MQKANTGIYPDSLRNYINFSTNGMTNITTFCHFLEKNERALNLGIKVSQRSQIRVSIKVTFFDNKKFGT